MFCSIFAGIYTNVSAWSIEAYPKSNFSTSHEFIYLAMFLDFMLGDWNYTDTIKGIMPKSQSWPSLFSTSCCTKLSWFWSPWTPKDGCFRWKFEFPKNLGPENKTNPRNRNRMPPPSPLLVIAPNFHGAIRWCPPRETQDGCSDTARKSGGPNVGRMFGA